MSRLDLPRVIGHRGAAASAPENTRASFLRAAQLGALWVELDVQLTKDGVPVVIHDDRLDRTTDGQGLVVDTTLDDLKALDAGSWFAPEFQGERIPTLAEALECIQGLRLGVNIEIKADEDRGAETARAALAVARQVWRRDPPLVSSFARSALEAAQEAASDWPRGFLVEAVPEDWKQIIRALRCVSLHADQKKLNPSRIREIRDSGAKVLAYTVNSSSQAERLWGWGCTAVFTDRPERLLTDNDLF